MTATRQPKLDLPLTLREKAQTLAASNNKCPMLKVDDDMRGQVFELIRDLSISKNVVHRVLKAEIPQGFGAPAIDTIRRDGRCRDCSCQGPA